MQYVNIQYTCFTWFNCHIISYIQTMPNHQKPPIHQSPGCTPQAAKSLLQGFCRLYTTSTNVATQVLTIVLQARSYGRPIWMLRGEVPQSFLGLKVSHPKNPRNLTWNLEITHFQTIVFRFHVNLRGVYVSFVFGWHNSCYIMLVSVKVKGMKRKPPSLKLGFSTKDLKKRCVHLKAFWQVLCYSFEDCAQSHVTWG